MILLHPDSDAAGGASPIDMDWLRECTDDDPEAMKSMLELYLTRTTAMLVELQGAINAESAEEVRRISHACAGSSGACGIAAMSPLFRELEAMGKAGNLAGAQDRAKRLESEFARVRAYITANGL